MNSIIGKKARITFQNGTTAEGVIIDWSDEQSILKSEGGEDLLIINNTRNNVVFIHVFFDSHNVFGVDGVIEPDPPVLDHNETNWSKRTNKLSQAKARQVQDLKRQVAMHLKRGPRAITGNNYVFPNFQK